MKRIKEYLRRNPGAAISIVIIVVICVCLIIKNITDTRFFSASAIDIITILLGALIAFYLTERMNDRRRRNDCIEHIVSEIETFVSDEANFKVDKETLMKHGSCANRIKYLKDASFSDIREEINFIDDKFSEIRDLYSNHSKDQNELDTVKIDIDKRRDLIVDKCCKIRIGMYSYIKLNDRTQ